MRLLILNKVLGRAHPQQLRCSSVRLTPPLVSTTPNTTRKRTSVVLAMASDGLATPLPSRGELVKSGAEGARMQRRVSWPFEAAGQLGAPAHAVRAAEDARGRGWHSNGARHQRDEERARASAHARTDNRRPRMRASTRTGGLTCTQCGPVSSDLSDADTDASLSLPLAASPVSRHSPLR